MNPDDLKVGEFMYWSCPPPSFHWEIYQKTEEGIFKIYRDGMPLRVKCSSHWNPVGWEKLTEEKKARLV